MSTMTAGFQRLFDTSNHRPRQLFIAGVLVVALVAFELFNFDTTRFALENLLGDVLFLGIGWATILAIAFCGIDLAGLVRLFTPQEGASEPKEVWYLMGAWLLGATMNAVMTWWAVSLTLLNNNFGNEVLSREQLLRYVPIFVAVLVWLTRILFIGSISMAGDHLLNHRGRAVAASVAPSKGSGNRNSYKRGSSAAKKMAQPVRSTPSYQSAASASPNAPAPVRQPVSNSNQGGQRSSAASPVSRQPVSSNGRVKQRPPRPGVRPSALSASARSPQQ